MKSFRPRKNMTKSPPFTNLTKKVSYLSAQLPLFTHCYYIPFSASFSLHWPKIENNTA